MTAALNGLNGLKKKENARSQKKRRGSVAFVGLVGFGLLCREWSSPNGQADQGCTRPLHRTVGFEGTLLHRHTPNPRDLKIGRKPRTAATFCFEGRQVSWVVVELYVQKSKSPKL